MAMTDGEGDSQRGNQQEKWEGDERGRGEGKGKHDREGCRHRTATADREIGGRHETQLSLNFSWYLPIFIFTRHTYKIHLSKLCVSE